MSIQNARLTIHSDSPFHSAYSPRRSVRVSIDPASDMTKQSFRDECDINVIMSRYQTTGILPQTRNALDAQYADVSGIDYQAAQNLVAGAKSMFMELPSSVRSRFDNDPGLFLAFTHDPKNREEMAKMGLLTPEAARSILNPQPLQNNSTEAVLSESPERA